jgi:hypothetical protein
VPDGKYQVKGKVAGGRCSPNNSESMLPILRHKTTWMISKKKKGDNNV